jgi:carboxylesterase
MRRPEGANIAFLLIHGFASAPDEVATLGEFLEEQGIASFAVRVAGHATSPEDLAQTTRDDWYSSAVNGLEVVKSWKPDLLFVAGLSMGGVLSLMLAARESEIDGIVAISPAVSIPSRLARLLPILKRVLKFREVDLEEIAQPYDVPRTKYPREPLSSIHELFKLAKEARKEMRNVTIPILILQSAEDKTINPESGRITFESVSSERKELQVIEGAEHVIPCHHTRSIAYPFIMEFVRRIEESR